MKVELLQNSVAEKKDVEESFAYIIYFYECPGSSVSQAIYISLVPVSPIVGIFNQSGFRLLFVSVCSTKVV